MWMLRFRGSALIIISPEDISFQQVNAGENITISDGCDPKSLKSDNGQENCSDDGSCIPIFGKAPYEPEEKAVEFLLLILIMMMIV